MKQYKVTSKLERIVASLSNIDKIIDKACDDLDCLKRNFEDPLHDYILEQVGARGFDYIRSAELSRLKFCMAIRDTKTVCNGFITSEDIKRSGIRIGIK